MALVPAFRCSHSGLYFPADYIKQWGRKYGIGLGSEPVSEVLDTDYLKEISECKHDHSRTMIAVGVTKAQVDFCMVEEEEYLANQAILAMDDPQMVRRSDVIREKQKNNSPKLASLFVK